MANWHKAIDGRGLTEATRSQYNIDMLDFLLEDWMPWYWYDRDYSTIDPLRPLKGIKGLTREVVVAIIANVESLEHRRKLNDLYGPEHPRASTTDDVEGFFSIIHNMFGRIFDHKTFKDNTRKICNEFSKRLDADLPFYYWTGTEDRYTIGELPSFNEPSRQGIERLDRMRIERRADPGVFHANRASLPRRGALSVRAEFHSLPELLPPPPNVAVDQ
ncbi:uncharacterized protein [Ptychodera flava]|uniref:uncharacterized protein n=1 Tax=Ptychodera flava TaxID=63121 RepID=UPI00396A3CC1